MDISKDYLKTSILSVYKDFLLGLNDNMKEINEMLNNPDLLSEDDRLEIKAQMKIIDNLNKTEDLYCYTDGSTKISTPTPTEKRKVLAAGCGYYVTYNNKELLKDSFTIPLNYQVNDVVQSTTIQMAEYQAILSAVRAIKSNHSNPRIANVTIYCDALVNCNQLNGEMKTRSPILSDFKKKIIEESSIFNSIKFIHIPREENTIANKLCRDAIRNN